MNGIVAAGRWLAEQIPLILALAILAAGMGALRWAGDDGTAPSVRVGGAAVASVTVPGPADQDSR